MISGAVPSLAQAHYPSKHGYRWTCLSGDDGFNGRCYYHHANADAVWAFAQLPSANPEAAIRQGAADWDGTFSHEFNYVYGAGSVTVYWDGDDPCGNASFAGCAVVTYVIADQHIVESETWIELESDIGWNATISGTVAPNQLDLWSGAAHEFGHVVGVGHSTNSYATMYPVLSVGDGSHRVLHTDDRTGRCQVYGHAHGYWGGCGTLR